MKTLLVIVNYNTSELLSHLLYSLFRIVGHRRLRPCDILVIDNNSKDDSVPIIQEMVKAKLINAIYNTQQLYHAPALNQALQMAYRQDYEFLWALDSDVVVLRRRMIRDAISCLQREKIDLLAQRNNAKECHPSCMVVRTAVAKRISARFRHGGNPVRNLQRQLLRSGAIVCNFPFRDAYYILHAGCGTRKAIKDIGDKRNAWFSDIADCTPWYHGDPIAPMIHEDFRKIFRAEIPVITPEALRDACLDGSRIRLDLPAQSPGRDPKVLSPTERGKQIARAKRKKQFKSLP